MTPTITVLMPMYNGMAFLREAIESVLCQTRNDFEFLIVDDASTDGSAALVASYHDARIRLVHRSRNAGQARTLNYGLALARGAYLVRLDQDDVCAPTRLERQIGMMEAHPELAITCTWEHTIDGEGRRVRSWRGEIPNVGDFLGTTLLGKCAVWHPSVAFRTQTVAALGGYRAEYAPSDDYDLWVRLAMARCEAAIVPEFLVHQRVHGGRQSVQRLETQLAQVRRIHEALVRSFFPSSGDAALASVDAGALAALLRVDGEFWELYTDTRHMREAVMALPEFLRRVDDRLRLSAVEAASLRRRIYGRLGLGARWAPTILSRLPSRAFRWGYFALSPMQVMPCRRLLSFPYRLAYELRHPVRFVRAGFRLGT